MRIPCRLSTWIRDRDARVRSCGQSPAAPRRWNSVHAATFAAILALWTGAASAIPYVTDKTLGPVGFAKGSTVTVYIERDPFANDPNAGTDRAPSAEEGALKWKDGLKAVANIDLKVVKLDANGKDPATGRAPDYTQPGTVRLSWDTADQFKAAHQEGAAAYADHASQRSDPPPGGKAGPRVNARLTTGGAVHLSDKGLGIAQASRDAALRSTIHELGHVLGMTHTQVVAAMHRDLMMQPFPGEVTEADVVELGAVYGLSAAQVKTATQKKQAGAQTYYEYRYTAEFRSGDAGALFQVALEDPSDVFDLQAPPGWIAILGSTFPAEPDTDVIPASVPDGAGAVLTFRADILGDTVPYLSAGFPVLTFGFSSPLAPVDGGLIWAGSLQTVATPQRVTEPAPMLLGLLAGAIALGVARRRVDARRPPHR